MTIALNTIDELLQVVRDLKANRLKPTRNDHRQRFMSVFDGVRQLSETDVTGAAKVLLEILCVPAQKTSGLFPDIMSLTSDVFQKLDGRLSLKESILEKILSDRRLKISDHAHDLQKIFESFHPTIKAVYQIGSFFSKSFNKEASNDILGLDFQKAARHVVLDSEIDEHDLKWLRTCFESWVKSSPKFADSSKIVGLIELVDRRFERKDPLGPISRNP